jgi:thimet oligopeptidase
MKLWQGMIGMAGFLGVAVATDLACAGGKSREGIMYQISSVEDVVALFPTTVAQINTRIDVALQAAQKELVALIAIPDNQRTFANTALALDRIVSLSDLAIASRAIGALEHVSPDQAVREAAHNAVMKVNDFLVEHISNNVALYKAFKAYVDGNAAQEKLTDNERYYLSETMKDFERAGLNLPQDKRDQVTALKKELAKLEQDFSANIAKDNRTICVPREELRGLDQDFIDSLKRTDDGLYILGVDYPTYFNVMENCSVQETRKQLSIAFENRAYPVNAAVLQSIITKRHELAQLLGFQNYAQLNLDNAMAGTPERVREFLHEVQARVNLKEKQEFEQLRKDLPEGISVTAHGKMLPWDMRYTKTYYKKKHFNIDERAIAEYFPMEKTVQGLLDIYRKFFSIDFKEVPVSGLWHSDVKLIKVVTADTGATLGYLLLDLHPRDNKFSHACEIGVIPAVAQGQGTQWPVVAIVLANFPASTPTKPSLLKRDDVNTFFHEFGHALHEILGRTTLGSQAGTATKRDFVELPSQMLEEWLWDAAMLKKVSSHYKTGEPLPDELIAQILKLKNFDTGSMLQRQLLFAFYSLDLFSKGAAVDPFALYGQEFKDIIKHIEYEPAMHMAASFGHLTEYAAQYYGYLWSKVFALDLFGEIKKHGLLNPEIGKRYTQEVIGKGGSQDPNELLVNFLGRQPNSDAFFKDLGL